MVLWQHTATTNGAPVGRITSWLIGCVEKSVRFDLRRLRSIPQRVAPKGIQAASTQRWLAALDGEACPVQWRPLGPLLFPSHGIRCHAMPCHPLPCHAMPSHPVPSHPVPCRRRSAEGVRRLPFVLLPEPGAVPVRWAGRGAAAEPPPSSLRPPEAAPPRRGAERLRAPPRPPRGLARGAGTAQPPRRQEVRPPSGMGRGSAGGVPGSPGPNSPLWAPGSPAGWGCSAGGMRVPGPGAPPLRSGVPGEVRGEVLVSRARY